MGFWILAVQEEERKANTCLSLGRQAKSYGEGEVTSRVHQGMEGGIKKRCSSYSTGIIQPPQKKETLPLTTPWRKLKDPVLSEISQLHTGGRGVRDPT